MQTGDFFNERYIVEGILGKGGMGTVYLARNINTDTYWAIKEINMKADKQINLAAEPNLLKKLNHPALPRLFDIIEQDGFLYMISDYIDGVSLDKKLEEEGSFDEEIVVDWAIQLCRALDYLHSLKPNPIIYRDIKPSNIMLTDSGRLKLIDFGTAREYKPQSDADTVYIGTRGYAAPEQFGTGQTSAVSDIYSLGITLHHLLTGKSPVEAPYRIIPIRYYNQQLSAGLEAIISKCTSEAMSSRYQSVTELMEDLLALQEGQYTDNNKHCSMDTANIDNTLNAADPEKRPEQARSFKRLVITVWDNAEFACELAYTAARYTGSEVLVADLDLLAPKADLILNTGKYPLRSHESATLGHSGLDMVMDAVTRGVLTSVILKQAAIVKNDMKNLYIITGNYKLDNFEYYSEDSVPQIIEKCYRGFDITILLVNRSIYDAFTLSALLRSDMNIAAIRGDISSLREFNTYIAFLNEKQHLPPENTRFVLFEHDKSCQMGEAEVRQATQDNLLGCISYSRKRSLYRNLKGAYVSHMEKEILSEYYQIHERLGMVPAVSLLQKLLRLLSDIFTGSKHKKGSNQEV